MDQIYPCLYPAQRTSGHWRFSCDRLYLQDEYDPLDRVQAGGGTDYGNRGYFPAGTPQGCGAAWTEEDHGFYYSFDSGKEVKERFADKTVNELIKACFDMGEVKTGALIVIEQEIRLDEYIRTGINVDAILTSQLLINIFEHNTPLHDGAVIVRKNRIVAATCYLPLSDNMELSKQLGTRHRAGVGISEVTDSVTIIVSEETGQVSVAEGGRLMRNVSSTELREVLERAQNKKIVDNNKLRQFFKGRVKHEEKSGK